MTESAPSFLARLSLAFGTFFRLLGDGGFAQRLARFDTKEPPRLPDVSATPATPQPSIPTPRDLGPAMQLLGVLQREGRFVDFIRQDITAFSDADVGAAARIVHQGCRRALDQIAGIESIRQEKEGSALALDAGFDPKQCRLIGDVRGEPPYRGTLRHAGWRITNLELEEPLASADLTILAPAEVEL